MQKFYDEENIKKSYLSPYVRVERISGEEVKLEHIHTGKQVLLRGRQEDIRLFYKFFVVNVGIEYEGLSSFFSGFEGGDDRSFVYLLQEGFLE